MKKTLLLVIALCTVTMSNAQDTETTTTTTTTKTITGNKQEELGFAKGDLFISGAIGYTTISYNENTSDVNSFKFTSKFGGFTSDYFALGVTVGYHDKPLEYFNNQYYPSNSKIITIGIFGRFYFRPTQKLSLFLEGGYNLNKLTTETESYSNSEIVKTKFKGHTVGITPGISYFLNKHFALEASWGILQYDTIKLDEEDIDSDSLDSFSVGLDFEDINFALLYKF